MIKLVMKKISEVKEFIKSKKDDEKFEERVCITLAFLFLIFGVTGMFMYLNYILEPAIEKPYVENPSGKETHNNVKK
jgi:hypothetical protein